VSTNLLCLLHIKPKHIAYCRFLSNRSLWQLLQFLLHKTAGRAYEQTLISWMTSDARDNDVTVTRGMVMLWRTETMSLIFGCCCCCCCWWWLPMFTRYHVSGCPRLSTDALQWTVCCRLPCSCTGLCNRLRSSSSSCCTWRRICIQQVKLISSTQKQVWTDLVNLYLKHMSLWSCKVDFAINRYISHTTETNNVRVW